MSKERNTRPYRGTWEQSGLTGHEQIEGKVSHQITGNNAMLLYEGYGIFASISQEGGSKSGGPTWDGCYMALAVFSPG